MTDAAKATVTVDLEDVLTDMEGREQRDGKEPDSPLLTIRRAIAGGMRHGPDHYAAEGARVSETESLDCYILGQRILAATGHTFDLEASEIVLIKKHTSRTLRHETRMLLHSIIDPTALSNRRHQLADTEKVQ